MSYFPILEAPGCVGQTTLHNLAPNNWEGVRKETRLVNLTWPQSGCWRSVVIDELAFGTVRTFVRSDVVALVPHDAMPLLSLGVEPLPSNSDTLPPSIGATCTPAWRATLALASSATSTCYQGELDPFPAPGSLLTFAPFLQFGAGIENYMLLLNLENNSNTRTSMIEIYDSATLEQKKGSVEVRSNSITAVRLDGLGLGPEDLPVLICRGMSGIPLYFSKTVDGAYLSLEHTHPPASYVIHGKRWDAQKILKTEWFAKLGQI